MIKYFLSTVVPNGFSVRDGKHWLRLSICLELDPASLAETDTEAMETDNHSYKKRFGEFYESFDNIYDTFHFDNIEIIVDGNPIKRDSINQISEICSGDTDSDSLNEVKVELWNNIFARKTKLTKTGLVPNTARKDIGNLTRIKKAVRFDSPFISMTDHLPYMNKHSTYQLDDYFIKTRRATNAYLGPAIKLAQKYTADLFVEEIKRTGVNRSTLNTTAESSISSFVMNYENNLRRYVEENIDPEEFINTFNTINKNIILKKLLDFIIEVEIEVNDLNPRTFLVSACVNDPGWCNLSSTIQLVSSNNKFAYLLYSTDTHFGNTILVTKNGTNSITRVLTFDTTAQNEKMKAWTTKHSDDASKSYAQKADSFTRGMIYMHDDLAGMIKQVDYVRNNDNSINESMPLNDTTIVHGHRVAVFNEDSRKFSSLTSRSIQVYTADESKPQVKCPITEGCIHFDAVTHKMNDDGTIGAVSSDVLFEWNGQQLTLKSAFSHASSVSKKQKDIDALNNPDTDGMQKSQFNTEKHLYIDSFPFKESPHKKEAKVKVLYDLPKINRKDINRLRFGNTYRFVVSQEYKNGWGMPLFPDQFQLSVQDILEQDAYGQFISEARTFYPLENKKPVLLYPRNEIKENDETATIQTPLHERESLKHLIVRSETGQSESQIIAERHILPERISLEHAFWYDLLSDKYMTDAEKTQWKRRYNCRFLTEANYVAFLNEKDKEGKFKHKGCPEGCDSYCGGTQMNSYYPEDHITPKFLTNPHASGFTLKLFWDEDCTIPFIDFKIQMNFGGNQGISPESYLLRASGSASETSIATHKLANILEIYLKKGMNVFAQIDTHLNSDGTKEIETAWWDQNPDYNFAVPADYKVIRNEKDSRKLPLVINLTHAVREPLTKPYIDSFYSAKENTIFITHIREWLSKPEFNDYKIELNIISVRSPNGLLPSAPGGTFANFILSSYFERLDATKEDEDFLPDVLPTGGLELWMRKESFVDDPLQIVLPPSKNKSRLNHIPDQPVRSFDDPLNEFSQDYKIVFTNQLLDQIKDKKYAFKLGKIKDLYRDVLTKMFLAYDFKTTKFEEREYYLKDISKFSGFFDQGNDPEEFVLPKLSDIMAQNSTGLRFRLMILNNKPPSPPEVAFAVTTIREVRTYPDRKHTISNQKGNIVTFYLKRGRLSSGKDERVGIIVNAGGIYNQLFQDMNLMSMAGRDIVSDRFSPASLTMRKEDILLPTVNEFDAGFDDNLGIWHFLPMFDIEKQLWKFEVELDIKTPSGAQMHNPFISFSLVHYQPFSVNYNNQKTSLSVTDLDFDCRISKAITAVWCYLLPEREVSVYFHKPAFIFGKKGSAVLTVSFDPESLHYFHTGSEYIIRSNFILTVEGSHNKVNWYPLPSILNGESESHISQPLLTKSMTDRGDNQATIKLEFDKHLSLPGTKDSSAHTIGFCHFRLRFVEVEWFEEKQWTDMQIDKNKDILENENLRTRYVELIY